MNVTIRTARQNDTTTLASIERSAASRFRLDPDLAWIADSEPQSPEAYRPMIAGSTVWVAEDAGGTLAGFLAAERADHDLHIWEVSVVAEHQGRGIGRRLFDAARSHAEAAGLSALTLTTFRDVPWNAPLYASLGFEMLAESDLGPRLVSILAQEVALGFSPERRCAMRYRLFGQGAT